MILGFVWGVMNGCFVAVDFAIAIDTLPDKQEAAKFLGVWGVSAFVGTTLGPITGGLALYFLGQIEDKDAFERAKERMREGGRGGLGILLMHRCSDRLEYLGKGNVVRIEKALHR